MTSLRHAAVEYALGGFPVFPLEPMGKRPVVEHGFKVATCEEPLVSAWWGRTPNGNIGMATGPLSGVLVLDVDPEHGGNESLQALPPRPMTWVVETPSGGWHYWYRYPSGVRLGNTAGKLGPGLDTRGDGGYVVLPPSVGHNGRPYSWAFREDLADAPGWLVEALAPPARTPRQPAAVRWSLEPSAYGLAALAREVADVALAAEGTRNNRLFYAACRLGELEAGGELPVGIAVDRLVDAGLAAGLRLDEAEATVRSGLKRGADNPRSAA